MVSHYYHKIKNEQELHKSNKNKNKNNSNSNSNINSNSITIHNAKKKQTTTNPTTIKSSRIIMKVKELSRNLLLKQQSDHVVNYDDGKKLSRHLFKQQSDRVVTYDGKKNITTTTTSATTDNKETAKMLDSESEYEYFDLLGIASNPSTVSTAPSSTFVNITAFDDDDSDSGSGDGDYENVAALFLFDKDEFGHDEDDDDADDDDSIAKLSDLYKTKSGDSDETMGHVTGKDHVKLLQKQAPVVIVENENHTSGDIIDIDDDIDDDDDDRNNSMQNDEHNNTPIILRDQILTKATLDDMCRGDQYESTCNTNDKEKKEEEKLSSLLLLLPDSITEEHHFETTPFVAGCNNNGQDFDENSSTDTSSVAVSSFSQLSDDAPSIVPSVLVSKMANLILDNHNAATAAANGSVTGSHDYRAAPVRRRFVDPKELSFLNPSSSSSSSSSYRSYSGSGNERGNKAAIEINGPSKPISVKNTAVSLGIRKFGGPAAPKTLIARRTDQLNEEFEKSKAAVFVTRKTWTVNTSGGPGTYKGKMVVDKVVRTH